ncbi:MFS general substrate transporter [Leucogyrophana mollusca]|uniref:MFS general substrate transporter n=1 Tax=Leucogyrophana mollusca TaxID=85980 RepID=A0ACB8B925_9AGAM|nr:MFS general substrate transporter [Leucogyrophana mollusca]
MSEASLPEGNHAPATSSEATPLLQSNSNPTIGPDDDSKRPKFSPATLVIPVAIVCHFASLLPSTTSFLIIQRIACKLWYAVHDPDNVPPDGRVPEALCSVPLVKKQIATVFSAIAVIDGLGVIIGCSASSFFASRYGRKPTLLGIIGLAVAGQAFIIGAQFAQGWLGGPLLVLWEICSQAIGNQFIISVVVNMYIVDTVREEDRTAALSTIAGWSSLGGALSFTAGGVISTSANDTLIVYIITGALLATACLYIALVLPESFPEAKQDELRRQRALATVDAGTPGGTLYRLASYFSIVFEPLKLLKPTTNPHNGRRNWRLVYCAIHVFIATLGDGYLTVGMILYFTTQYNYTSAEAGYVLTLLYLSGVFVLAVVIPPLVRLLRPYYTRRPSRSGHPPGETPDELVEAGSTDLLDAHITLASWFIEAVAYILVGVTTTLPTQLAAVVAVGLGAGRRPAARSLVAASVDPLVQGEALAAVELVSSIGLLLSPVVMGGILAASIATMPQLVFYAHAAIVMLAAAILLLVREGDRYHTH